jgi:hypothetical protein
VTIKFDNHDWEFVEQSIHTGISWVQLERELILEGQKCRETITIPERWLELPQDVAYKIFPIKTVTVSGEK